MEMLLIIIIIVIIIVFIEYITYDTKKTCNFFDIYEIQPTLSLIKIIHNQIKYEVTSFNSEWYPWPEKELYSENMSWNVIPFYGFGKWSTKNIIKFPIIYNFIKDIPGIKTAGLSKLSGGTKLNPHRGWGKLSNNVIRCHYGIIVPDGCYISVKDDNSEEIKIMKEKMWLSFDDSKTHYANNTSNKDRIVLLIDISRPDFIKSGNSDVLETEELKSFIDLY
jgi:hypothetical protein